MARYVPATRSGAPLADHVKPEVVGCIRFYRTTNAIPSRVYYMRENHGRADVFVAQEFLGLADVVAHLRM